MAEWDKHSLAFGVHVVSAMAQFVQLLIVVVASSVAMLVVVLEANDADPLGQIIHLP
jgi:hypothetical protein